MKRKVVLLSGGLDSTVLFYDLLYQDDTKVEAIWIDYGQKNAEAERNVVRYLCGTNVVALKEIECRGVFSGVKSTLLKDVEGKHSVESDEIPNRNAVLISIAASHIEGEATLCVGAHKTGAAYADATPKFYQRMSKAIHWSTNSRIDVEAPYINRTKRGIVQRAWDIALTPSQLSKTMSCYEGTNCGTCPACKARALALLNSPYNF